MASRREGRFGSPGGLWEYWKAPLQSPVLHKQQTKQGVHFKGFKTFFPYFKLLFFCCCDNKHGVKLQVCRMQEGSKYPKSTAGQRKGSSRTGWRDRQGWGHQESKGEAAWAPITQFYSWKHTLLSRRSASCLNTLPHMNFLQKGNSLGILVQPFRIQLGKRLGCSLWGMSLNSCKYWNNSNAWA